MAGALYNESLTTPLAFAVANGTGTPLVTGSCAENVTGEGVGGNYALSFSSVVASTSATVTVTPENALHYRSGDTFTVLLDGTTAYTNVVPGASLVFSNAGGFTNTWTATVTIGDYLGAYNAGDGAQTGVRYALKNTGSTTLLNCKAIVNRPKGQLVRTGGNGGLKSVFVYNTSPVEATTGSPAVTTNYPVTFASYTAGSPNKINVLVSGGLVTVTDVNGTVTSAGGSTTSSQLWADGTSKYRITSGGLSGVEFVLRTDAGNGDSAAVTIWAASNFQIASDTGGVAGTYGTSDVTITQAGQSSGTIQAGQAGYFWARPNIAAGASPYRNPVRVDVVLSYSDTGAANVGA